LLLAVTHSDDLYADSDQSEAGFDSWTVEDEAGNRYSGADAWHMALAFVPMSRFFDVLLHFRFVRQAIWGAARVVAGDGSLPVQQTEPGVAFGGSYVDECHPVADDYHHPVVECLHHSGRRWPLDRPAARPCPVFCSIHGYVAKLGYVCAFSNQY
jgi:hypothetical protein